MLTNDVVLDGFERIKRVVHAAVEGLSEEQLAARPAPDANSIAWLVWHLTRVQDDHVAEAAGHEQVWAAGGWAKKFGLPFSDEATGYGHTAAEVGKVHASAELLAGYYDAVHAQTVAYVGKLTAKDYERVVDKGWNPPVTLAVRLVSVLSDDMQHAGQAAYARGLLK
jgi:uncharacterized damage-inducible protein DinB